MGILLLRSSWVGEHEDECDEGQENGDKVPEARTGTDAFGSMIRWHLS